MNRNDEVWIIRCLERSIVTSETLKEGIAGSGFLCCRINSLTPKLLTAKTCAIAGGMNQGNPILS